MTRDSLLQEEMRRREAHVLEPDSPHRVYFASPEDTVLQKLDWYKKGDGVSDRQWQDLVGVIKVQGASLDVSYLRRWSPSLGVEDLLEHALTEGTRVD